MCRAALAESLLPHAPELPLAGSPLEVWSQAAERMLWVMFDDRCQELTTNHPATEVHQRAVAGLACAMVAMMDPRDDDRRLSTGVIMAARYHDLGKGREEILSILDIERRYTPAEKRTMAAHASYGAEDFSAFAAENLEDPSLPEDPDLPEDSPLRKDKILFSIVRHAIHSHHDRGGQLRPVDFDTDIRKLRVGVGVLQAADMAQAMLTPVGRAYRLDRLVGEGLASIESRFGADPVLVPNVDAIARDIGAQIGINSLGQLARGGVTMRDLVALGVELMSDSDPAPRSGALARGGIAGRRWRIPRFVPRLVGSLD